MDYLNFKGDLRVLISLANAGKEKDVDEIFSRLTYKPDFTTTRNVDFALSLVTTTLGVSRIKYYLFSGTQIQRNYACLFLNRIGDFNSVQKAFESNLIDEVQAFSR